jgi:hypothetical protein
MQKTKKSKTTVRVRESQKPLRNSIDRIDVSSAGEYNDTMDSEESDRSSHKRRATTSKKVTRSKNRTSAMQKTKKSDALSGSKDFIWDVLGKNELIPQTGQTGIKLALGSLVDTTIKLFDLKTGFKGICQSLNVGIDKLYLSPVCFFIHHF